MRDLKLSEQEKDEIRLKGRTIKGYFNKVYMSVSAAAKMLNHSHFGQPKEVMGLLQGFYQQVKGHGVFQITDAIALPVEASETRVTADDETYGLIAIYSEWVSKIGSHNILGWYHSHPSYGCWLSGIDVDTSSRYQLINDPFVAIVIDPIKSLSFQKLNIGAFRVYSKPEHEQKSSKGQDVPRKNIVDFGHHCHRYYELPIELFHDEVSKKSMSNLSKIQWSTELSNSNFFSQLSYLIEAVNDEKEDINQYFSLLEEKVSFDEIREKKASTVKKVSYYAQERNLSLLDSGIKSLLF